MIQRNKTKQTFQITKGNSNGKKDMFVTAPQNLR